MALRVCVAVTTAAVGLTCFFATPVFAVEPSDGRGYEMVSPADKNGGDITGNGVSTVAAEGGDAIAFFSRASFGDTKGSAVLGQTQYLASREATGWVTHTITPTPAFDALQTLTGATEVVTFADDLRTGLVWALDLPDVDGETDHAANAYVEDTATGDLELITASQADPVGALPFANNVQWGASRDARHIALVSTSRLLPAAPSDVPSVYEWDNGTLRLASILPDGNVAVAGSTIIPERFRRMVSPDGSRVYFQSPPDGGQLYARIDHSRTAWISQPETSNASTPPTDVVVQDVTGDGRHVLFTTSAALLDADTNDGSDLYLYTDTPEPAADANLTLLTNTGGFPGTLTGLTPVIGSSDDGTRVYFQTPADDIMLWDRGTVRVVASGVGSTEDLSIRLSAQASAPGGARVTPDGRYLGFLARGEIRHGQDTLGETSNGHLEMYVYDATTDALRCASCAEVPATSDAAVEPTVTPISPALYLPGARPTFVARNGRVFFSTDSALTTGDTNAVSDAYQFNPTSGRAELLSSGRGAGPASFVNASASGDDVFIATRQRLVPEDRDDLVDLYDARVGGGFPVPLPPAPPCQSDDCQRSSTLIPPDGPMGSETFQQRKSRPSTRRLRAARKLAIQGPAGTLRIKVRAAGRLSWSGKGLRSGLRRYARPGVYRVPLVLTPSQRTRLSRHGILRVKLQLRFVAAPGGTSRATVVLIFSRSSKKER